jgi:hypothetical protein
MFAPLKLRPAAARERLAPAERHAALFEHF